MEYKKQRYIASFSGGKDSMATIILAKENNEPLDTIIFSEVMFDENISGELPEHIEFIKMRCQPLFESWGYEFEILRAAKTYMDCFNHIATKGARKGMKLGFPMAGKCIINRDCKLKPIKEYFKNKKEEIIQYIGVAIDEPKRLKKIYGTNKISLLAKYGYTEQMAMKLCEKYDLVSPIYKIANRGGCWFCPFSRDAELKHLRKEHNELWKKLLDLENEENLTGKIWNTLTKASLKAKEDLFRYEEMQLTIFDVLKEDGR